jgi:hypothetical protein
VEISGRNDKLNDKIKTALDESRMLILGTQILMGFLVRAPSGICTK